MFKTDEKRRNYIISLPRDKMPKASRENWISENESRIDFGGQIETKYNSISILLLSQLIFVKMYQFSTSLVPQFSTPVIGLFDLKVSQT